MSDTREAAAIEIADVHRFFDTLEMDRAPVVVEELARDWVRARLHTSEVKLRPGGYVPGPTLMAGVDLVAWVLVFTRVGIMPEALTWDLKINFLRPAHGADVILDARQTKFGRLCHSTVDLYLEGSPHQLVAHATTTYSVPKLP